jgi:hypothetical protein
MGVLNNLQVLVILNGDAYEEFEYIQMNTRNLRTRTRKSEEHVKVVPGDHFEIKYGHGINFDFGATDALVADIYLDDRLVVFSHMPPENKRTPMSRDFVAKPFEDLSRKVARGCNCSRLLILSHASFVTSSNTSLTYSQVKTSRAMTSKNSKVGTATLAPSALILSAGRLYHRAEDRMAYQCPSR